MAAAVPPRWRRPMAAALGVALIALFAAVGVLLFQSYGESERTTRDFQRATDATTGSANAMRETLLLGHEASELRRGDALAPVVLRRALLERQLDVVAAAAAGRRHDAAIRASLARFDDAIADVHGTGRRALARGDRTNVRDAFRELERQVKAAFDDEEHTLYAALRTSLDDHARDQLLILVLGAVALLLAAALALGLARAVRGRFAVAYDMLDRSQAHHQWLVEQLPAVVYTFSIRDDGTTVLPTYVSPQTEAILGLSAAEAQRDPQMLFECVVPEDRTTVAAAIATAAATGHAAPVEFRFRRPDGREIWLRDSGAAAADGPDGRQLHGLLFDITAVKEMELELRLAQKLEAVGELAAGVAHEINTPIQYVGDTVRFLEGAFDDLVALQASYDELGAAATSGAPLDEPLARVADAVEAADVEYLRERVPAAFERAGDGIRRVATIVGAMREFAHPPTNDQAPVDLNRALESTLIVAANEYKYVADVETDLAELPDVVCNGGDLNQVFLNLIVNAAHAIQDQHEVSGERGRIAVSTRRTAEHVIVTIADTGGGIPAEIAGRVFDPFFTTKDVGRGTGQGLAIARTLVVERHGGGLTFEVEPGHGTTFHVRLPIAGNQQLAAAA